MDIALYKIIAIALAAGLPLGWLFVRSINPIASTPVKALGAIVCAVGIAGYMMGN